MERIEITFLEYVELWDKETDILYEKFKEKYCINYTGSLPNIKNETQLIIKDNNKPYNKMSNKLRKEMLFEQKGKCYVCGIEEWKYKKRLDAHRIIPGKNGGLYTVSNVRLVCSKCHSEIEGLSLPEIIDIREKHDN